MSDDVCKTCKYFIAKYNSTLGICIVDSSKSKTMNMYSKSCEKHVKR